MSALGSPSSGPGSASIIVIDLSLAGDNALVIALAVRSLARARAVLGRVWGTAAAVVLRVPSSRW